MQTSNVAWGGVLLRVLLALVVVFATWNPDGFSYWDWAIAPMVGAGGKSASLSSFGPVKALAGIALAIGWVVILQATRRSIGLIGAILCFALAACVLWLLIDWHVVSASSTRGAARAVLVILGIVLGIGLSWSSLRGRLTGQVDTEHVD